jgi:membrane-bound lytic murein transglycosylase A
MPLYRRPNDLITVNLGCSGMILTGTPPRRTYPQPASSFPFESRLEINQGALEDKNLELLWVDDPADAFFLSCAGIGPDHSRRR